MQREKIINVLKTSKKFSKSNFEYGAGEYGFYHNIIYTIGDHKYEIENYNSGSKFVFYYDTSSFGVKFIQNSMVRETLTEKKVLYTFGKLIKNINKLDSLLLKKEDIINKIKPIIVSILKKEYDFDSFLPDLIFGEDNFKVKFPNSTKFYRRRSKSTSYNIEIEDPDKISYDITYRINERNLYVALHFNYSSISNKLILIKKEESYKNRSKDVTKIIRSEKRTWRASLLAHSA